MSVHRGPDRNVAIVTGAASGIGRATAQRLFRDGAQVALLDRDAALLEETAAALDESLPIVIDLRRPDEIAGAFDQVERHFGGFDKVAHIAGVAAQQHIKQRLAEMLESGAAVAPAGFDFTAELSDSEWHDIIDLNLNATFYVLRRALQSMIPRRTGAIVTVSSMAVNMPFPGHAHYSAAKAGVKSLTQVVAREVIGYGIRVNCVSPGTVITGMYNRAPVQLREGATQAPIGRAASADELASVIAFLLGDESTFVVGETVNVNGGALMD